MKVRSVILQVILITIVGFFMIKEIRENQKKDGFTVIKNDVNFYYSYLPAIFIYHDLSFSFTQDLEEEDKRKIWVLTDQEGNKHSKMTAGNAVMYTPFFLAAHAFASATKSRVNGYSTPYDKVLHYSSLFYLILALILLSRFLRQYFTWTTVIVTLVTICLGTNIFYYTTYESAMSHVYSFFLIALFLVLTQRWHNRGFRSTESLLMGAVLGLITLVRPNNFVVFLIPLLYGISSLSDIKGNITMSFKNFKSPLLLILGFLMISGIQAILWKIGTGNWMVYSYGEEGFFFLRPHIIDGLFSYRKGWLIYTPVMIFSLLGLVWVRKYAKEWKWALPVYLLVHIYITFSWWCWWYGGSFGSRPMIETYAVLSIPFAATVEHLTQNRWWARIAAVLVFYFFIKFNFFQTNQYYVTLIHWDSMTEEAYWSVFWEEQFPENYKDMLQTPDYEKAKKGIDEY